jgi:predicted alpha/beta superfamily hydrolase
MSIYLKTTTIFIAFWLHTLTFWAQVTIIVDEVPANTPAADSLYIAGTFNGWNPGDASHQLTHSPALQTYTVVVGSGSGNIQFKFTRGSWPTVEGTSNGTFIPNRNFSYSSGDTVYLQIAGWEDLGGGSSSTAAENVEVLADSFFMPQLNRYRRVWVYVPPDYDSTNYRYPVLYMHDGQNVFDATTAFSGEWEVDETLNELHAAGDTGIIVVAVDNGQGHRLDEYSPWVNPNYGGGQGDEYVDFLVQTLKPHIDSLYRTRPQREYTGIMGSSLGGLISTYAGIAHQDVFSKIGAFSPSYWFSDQSFTHVGQTGKLDEMRIYQLVGSQEGTGMVTGMQRMEDTLLVAGFQTPELMSVEKSDGQHSEWFWRREFAAAYEWLFRQANTPLENKLKPFTGLRLYPNPAQERVYVEMELNHTEELEVEVLDTLGKSYGQQTIPTRGVVRFEMRIEKERLGLSPGTYFLRIRSGDAVVSRQFVFLP